MRMATYLKFSWFKLFCSIPIQLYEKNINKKIFLHFFHELV